MTDTDVKILTPSYMKGIDEYTPRKEWLLVSAFLLRTSASDLDWFWNHESWSGFDFYRPAIDELSAAFDVYDNTFHRIFTEEYGVDLDIALQMEVSARAIYDAMLKYLVDVMHLVRSYDEAKFFDLFNSLEEVAPKFCYYAWGKVDPNLIDFAGVVISLYFHLKGTEIKDLLLGIEEKPHTQAAVVAHLIDFFEVLATEPWGRHDPRLKVSSCHHTGTVSWNMIEQQYKCMQCGTPMDDEDMFATMGYY